MQQVLSENLEQFDKDVVTRLLEELPVERLFQVLAERLGGLPPEERLRGLSPEERLRGLSSEEVVAGLSEEEAARLRELLARKQGG